MNVGEVQEYKLKIGENEYTFRLDFKALMKFNLKYKDYKVVPVLEAGKIKLDKDNNPIMKSLGALDIFNKFINTPGDYEDLVKILSCACVDKEFTEEEILESLSFDFPTLVILDGITNRMIQGSLMLDKKGNSSGGNKEKN
jgi:hypothetical protein